MNALKFLGLGAVGLYSGFAWPTPKNGAPGPWIETVGTLTPGLNGVHACTPSSLVEWIDDELWVAELDGEVAEADGVLAGTRGRLIRRVDGWDAEGARAFAHSCVLSARDRAVEAMSGRDAELLAALDEPDELFAFSSARRPESDAIAFLADAVSLALGGRPDAASLHPAAGVVPTPGALAANLGFVVAHACGSAAAVAGRTYEAGFAAERERQLAWLDDRIELKSSFQNES